MLNNQLKKVLFCLFLLFQFNNFLLCQPPELYPGGIKGPSYWFMVNDDGSFLDVKNDRYNSELSDPTDENNHKVNFHNSKGISKDEILLGDLNLTDCSIIAVLYPEETDKDFISINNGEIIIGKESITKFENGREITDPLDKPVAFITDDGENRKIKVVSYLVNHKKERDYNAWAKREMVKLEFDHEGKFLELLIFERNLRTLEREKVESYLFLKYGFHPLSDIDIVNSNGEIIFDKKNFEFYDKLIGIGKDEAFVQRESNSTFDEINSYENNSLPTNRLITFRFDKESFNQLEENKILLMAENRELLDNHQERKDSLLKYGIRLYNKYWTVFNPDSITGDVEFILGNKIPKSLNFDSEKESIICLEFNSESDLLPSNIYQLNKYQNYTTIPFKTKKHNVIYTFGTSKSLLRNFHCRKYNLIKKWIDKQPYQLVSGQGYLTNKKKEKTFGFKYRTCEYVEENGYNIKGKFCKNLIKLENNQIEIYISKNYNNPLIEINGIKICSDCSDTECQSLPCLYKSYELECCDINAFVISIPKDQIKIPLIQLRVQYQEGYGPSYFDAINIHTPNCQNENP